MNLENNFEYIFFAIFAFVAGSFVFKIIKNGGFKAAMFGAPIARTVGEVEGSGTKLMNIKVKVHTLGGSQDKAIGLEFVAKSVGSYQMLPVTLSASEAKKLTTLLQAATSDSNAA
ncbi:MAG: hypothetical protein AB1831_14665 [Pseudomonadota bacterium]